MPPQNPEPTEQERMAANIRAWLDLMDFQAAIALQGIQHNLGVDADPWPEFRRRWAAASEEHSRMTLRMLENLSHHVASPERTPH